MCKQDVSLKIIPQNPPKSDLQQQKCHIYQYLKKVFANTKVWLSWLYFSCGQQGSKEDIEDLKYYRVSTASDLSIRE